VVAASWALSVAGPEGVLLAEPGVEPDEVQAVTASRAAAPMVMAAALTRRPRAVRPPGRGIDMSPIMPQGPDRIGLAPSAR